MTDAVRSPDSLSAVTATLRRAGCVFAEEEAALLISAAESPLELSTMVDRRVSGEPLEVIVGWAEFCGMRIVIEPAVFVPRRRTEFLVASALEVGRPGSMVVDLCCGSGAVGVAITAALGAAQLVAADVDVAAVRCAERNVLPLGGRVFQGDLFDALPLELRGRVDLLVVNAPYVPTAAVATMPPEARDHEPRVALDGGTDGLDVQRRVLAEAASWLTLGGHLLIETSDEQAPVTAALFAAAGLRAEVLSDDDLDATVVRGRR